MVVVQGRIREPATNSESSRIALERPVVIVCLADGSQAASRSSTDDDAIVFLGEVAASRVSVAVQVIGVRIAGESLRDCRRRTERSTDARSSANSSGGQGGQKGEDAEAKQQTRGAGEPAAERRGTAKFV